MDRTLLPYRKNCEGYFVSKNGEVLAQNTGLGYVEFPGGGVEDSTPEEAILRETKEEAGATITGLELLKVIHFDWGEDWAKTDKQKRRYQQFRGEEMYLFRGKIASLDKPTGDPETGEPGWTGERLIDAAELVELLESHRPFTKDMEEYNEFQIAAVKVIAGQNR